ncbi:MAG TPA: GNAT family N-acetyltransferase [Xanthobacteraceae bacterium]|nr:GNAT family N-acetyltransferase [Xanthobacteraceae bacterium]
MTSLETGLQEAALQEAALQEAASATSIPVLATKRLTLRAPGAGDAKAIASLINDRRIAENTARIPHPYSVADAHAFLGQANRDPRQPAFTVTRADGTLIGACGIHVLSGGEPELGYWIGVPYWGHGYATEAARAVLDHAFGALGYERLTSRARVSNPASRRVLEKCGFQWTGVSLIRIHALRSSAPVDCFRLDRGLWASLRSWGNANRVARGRKMRETGSREQSACEPSSCESSSCESGP